MGSNLQQQQQIHNHVGCNPVMIDEKQSNNCCCGYRYYNFIKSGQNRRWQEKLITPLDLLEHSTSIWYKKNLRKWYPPGDEFDSNVEKCVSKLYL